MTLQAFAGWVRPNPQLQNVRLITAANSPYTVAALDVFIGGDSSGGSITVNLPTASSSTGRVIEVYDVTGFANTNSITVQPSGGALISGQASQVIATSYGGLTVISDGTNWEIISSAGGGSAVTSGLVLLSTQLATTATSTTFSGLDGDTDKVYILEGAISNVGGGSMPFNLRVNNDPGGGAYQATTGATWSTFGGPVGTSVVGAGNPWYPYAANLAIGSRSTFSLRIEAARTQGAVTLIRAMTGDFTEFDAASGAVTRVAVGSSYNSAAANLTSLVFTNGGTSSYTGRISLYKLVT